jgi:AcrR family transcriptional regulator
MARHLQEDWMSPPDTTRARIREAAVEEFSAVGFAGARVDTIARRAGCNKQLIYHYFGDKAGLFEEVMRQIAADRPPIQALAGHPLPNLAQAYDHIQSKRPWMRMMMWEALTEDPAGPVVAEQLRQEHLKEVLGELRQLQDQGLFAPDLEPEMILLAAHAMLSAPLQMPHLARIVSGTSPSDPSFRERYLGVVARLLSAIVVPPPGS